MGNECYYCVVEKEREQLVISCDMTIQDIARQSFCHRQDQSNNGIQQTKQKTKKEKKKERNDAVHV